MEIWLIRHGKTAGNLLGRYIGKTDEPLCEEGIREAQRMMGYPRGEQVIVSPLLRARQTAAILFPQAAQTPVAALAEMDFGLFENRSAAEMEQDAAYRRWVDSGCMDACPDGDAFMDYQTRVCDAFEKLVCAAWKQKEERLLFVVHGGTIMAVLQRYTKPERPYYVWGVKNCCGYRAMVEKTQAGLLLTGVTPVPERKD